MKPASSRSPWPLVHKGGRYEWRGQTIRWDRGRRRALRVDIRTRVGGRWEWLQERWWPWVRDVPARHGGPRGLSQHASPSARSEERRVGKGGAWRYSADEGR